MWHSWQSGCFQYQRFPIQIQSAENFMEHLFTINWKWIKRGSGTAHFKTRIKRYFCRNDCLPIEKFYFFTFFQPTNISREQTCWTDIKKKKTWKQSQQKLVPGFMSCSLGFGFKEEYHRLDSRKANLIVIFFDTHQLTLIFMHRPSLASVWIFSTINGINFRFFKLTIPYLFSFIFGPFKQTVQFLHQINVLEVHLVCGAGIQTHNLLNTSLFPEPLDQGSRPKIVFI